jgi:hypothetical protein
LHLGWRENPKAKGGDGENQIDDCTPRVILQITRKVLHKDFAKVHGDEFISKYSKYKSVPIPKLPVRRLLEVKLTE